MAYFAPCVPVYVLCCLVQGKSMDQCIQLDMLGPITAPTVLQCTISYAALTGGEDDKDVKQTVPMQVPVSLFLSPVKISPADFKLVVSPHTTTATITLAVIPVADALKLVCNTLNVRLVQAVSFVASYYALVSAPSASSASPVHLCVQIKGSKSGEPTLGVRYVQFSTLFVSFSSLFFSSFLA